MHIIVFRNFITMLITRLKHVLSAILIRKVSILPSIDMHTRIKQGL